MLFTVRCPKCGAEQKGLNLIETEGYFVCSACDKKIKIDFDRAKRECLCTIMKKQ